jgi:vacuolar-type H+-ATPase subunit D/Vma8
LNKIFFLKDLSNERLVLLYSGFNEKTWHIDTDIRLIDSNIHDIITTDIQYLHSRMIVVRYDKQLMSLRQLQATISLFEQKLNQRSATLILRHRSLNSNEICLVCCSSQHKETISNEIQEENYSSNNEQIKEIILQEGQLLELRFRGNVLPIDNAQQSIPFAFNTYFPFYFETTISEIDKYAQHLSSYFYGYIQIFSKQKLSRNLMKEIEKKKQQIEIVSIF